ncbi:MAG: class I SAM-dependent DNA methyltransferase [Methanobacteriota archaeon]
MRAAGRRSRTPRERLYADLAWLWPAMSPKEDYVQEATFARDLIRRYARIPARTLLHLGCGGGHLDRTLKRHFRVWGIDRSRSMLRLARQLNPTVAYQLGDMRTLRLGARFDAVAAFDSIDYMRSEAELRAAFRTAWEHLRPGGVFLTYAEHTRETFAHARTAAWTRSIGDDVVTFVETLFDDDPRDSTFETVLAYLIRRKGRLRVHADRHVMGLFPLDTWTRLLVAQGFGVAVRRERGREGPRVPWLVASRPARGGLTEPSSLAPSRGAQARLPPRASR